HVASLTFFAGISCFLLRTWHHQNNWLQIFRATTLSFTACIAVASAFGILYPYIVLKNASLLAQDRPYCIALQKSRRPVESFQDLTFLTMDKLHHEHHAILLVKTAGGISAYGWSYLKTKFISGI